MTEEIFTELKFTKTSVSVEESGDSPYYYYYLDIGDITLISNANDEAERNGWFVSLFDSDTLKIRGGGDLKELVKIIELNT